MSFPSPARGVAVLGAAAALCCSVLVGAPAAWAHDSLTSSTPGDGTTVTNAPEAVSLGFSEAPLQLGAQVVVTAPDGRVVTQGSPTVVGNDVVQGLAPDRPAGSYTVDWRVTSSDGHPIQGRVVFVAEGGVGASAPSSSPSSPFSSTPPPATASTASTAGTASASPSTAPASAQDDDGSGISGATWAWTIAAGAAGGLVGLLLVRSRARSGRS